MEEINALVEPAPEYSFISDTDILVDNELIIRIGFSDLHDYEVKNSCGIASVDIKYIDGYTKLLDQLDELSKQWKHFTVKHYRFNNRMKSTTWEFSGTYFSFILKKDCISILFEIYKVDVNE